jgi:spore coat polysaccharide biosynthesis predicted glycosyltransferase SpsG
MKIAIITDGSNKIGMGHIYQSITLADALSQKLHKKVNIFFITKSDREVMVRLSEAGYKVCRYPDDNSILDALKNEKPNRIIFDKLNVAPILAERIKDTIDAKLIIFTNLTEANKHADVTIMAGMDSHFKNIYNKCKNTGKVNFWGPKYWLLRPEFYKYQKKQKDPLIKAEKIMLIFGGADSSNITSSVLKELLGMNSAFQITVALGTAFKHHKELNAILTNNRSTLSTVQIVKNLTNVAEKMHQNDVVFTSPGLSFFEALMVATPVLCFHQNEFQYNAWRGDIATLDKSEVYKIPQFLENNAFIYPDDPLVISMKIGKGKGEIIREILK